MVIVFSPECFVVVDVDVVVVVVFVVVVVCDVVFVVVLAALAISLLCVASCRVFARHRTSFLRRIFGVNNTFSKPKIVFARI